MRHLCTTGERLHEALINKPSWTSAGSVGHPEVWSSARVSEVCAGRLGATALCNTWKWECCTSPSRWGELFGVGRSVLGKDNLAIFF